MSVCAVRKAVSSRSLACEMRALRLVMSACNPLVCRLVRSAWLSSEMVYCAPVESVYVDVYGAEAAVV